MVEVVLGDGGGGGRCGVVDADVGVAWGAGDDELAGFTGVGVAGTVI